MNEHQKTFGITLFYGAAGGAAGTALAGIVGIDGLPDLVFDETEITELDQANKMKQWALSVADAGNLGVTLAMKNGTLTTLLAMADTVDRAWKIAFISGSTLTFEGPLKRVGLAGASGANSVINVPITVRVNSLPVYTPFTPPP